MMYQITSCQTSHPILLLTLPFSHPSSAAVTSFASILTDSHELKVTQGDDRYSYTAFCLLPQGFPVDTEACLSTRPAHNYAREGVNILWGRRPRGNSSLWINPPLFSPTIDNSDIIHKLSWGMFL